MQATGSAARSRTRPRCWPRSLACGGLLAALLAGCGEAAVVDPAELDPGRFGGLADLVLHSRPARDGGPFLLARFETTRADWLAWLAAADRALIDHRSFDLFNERDEDALPAVGMTLAEARDHAEWRLGRLPRIDEWWFAATAGGRYRLPWGDTDREVWANAAGLRIGRVVPVGAFESGHQRGGCYDLVGNAAEWTTSVPRAALEGRRGGTAGSWLLRMVRLDRHPALAPWQRALPVWPTAWLIAAADAETPRSCTSGVDDPMLVGWQSIAVPLSPPPGSYREAHPAERSSRVGMRVASDPRTVLRRIAAVPGRLRVAEEEALRRFLRREELRRLLIEAAVAVPELAADRPAARVVVEELGL